MHAPRPLVYVETSVISYLTGRPNRDLVIAANQQITAAWWPDAPARFELVASGVVVDEVAAGDPSVAAARLALLAGFRLLPVTPEARSLAAGLLRAGHLPPTAAADALHVAVAAAARADYLATWNMRHLAGAIVRRRIEGALRALGYDPPTICTPLELSPPTEPGAPDV
jgi:predicted nucleic acid-binding protein